jgi:hypothetical protein
MRTSRASASRRRLGHEGLELLAHRQPLSQVVLPFGPELLNHKPIHVAEADLLEVSQAAIRREQVFAVGVGAAEDVSDLAADRGNPALEILAVADQGPVLPQPGRGLVGLGDHVQDQEFGQDLGIRELSKKSTPANRVPKYNCIVQVIF